LTKATVFSLPSTKTETFPVALTISTMISADSPSLTFLGTVISILVSALPTS